MANQNVGIGIAVDVFATGIAIRYGIFAAAYQPSFMQNQNQMLNQMMQDRNMMNQWTNNMMSDQMSRQQMMKSVMGNQQFMSEMMTDPQFQTK